MCQSSINKPRADRRRTASCSVDALLIIILLLAGSCAARREATPRADTAKVAARAAVVLQRMPSEQSIARQEDPDLRDFLSSTRRVVSQATRATTLDAESLERLRMQGDGAMLEPKPGVTPASQPAVALMGCFSECLSHSRSCYRGCEGTDEFGCKFDCFLDEVSCRTGCVPEGPIPGIKGIFATKEVPVRPSGPPRF